MVGLSKHHLFWPRRDYHTRTEKFFRSLPCQIVLLDDFTHRMLHRHTEPPSKPSHEEMLNAIERHSLGQCRCITEGGGG